MLLPEEMSKHFYKNFFTWAGIGGWPTGQGQKPVGVVELQKIGKKR
jgi:hypothetical protein